MPCLICGPLSNDPGTTWYYCPACLDRAAQCKHEPESDGRCRKCGFYQPASVRPDDADDPFDAQKEALKET